MTKSIETYLLEGCGRCPFGGTPDCKIHSWVAELKYLSAIVFDCGLNEEMKWGVPCYTLDGKNVLIVSAFKECVSISFFKGALLNNENNLLIKPGENSQAARVIRFTDTKQIQEVEAEIKAAIFEAIEVEKAGLKIPFKKNPEPIPEELEKKFEKDPVFKSAFEELTPGRQRGYIIYFSGAKQPKTREDRIEKCLGKILNGEGLHDKYQRRKN